MSAYLICFAMSLNEKDPNFGKCHTAREKDFYRACPSKLNRRELEDMYYKLLDNNLELKQTLNSQTQDIRMLTTKLQRVTAQSKAYLSHEPKKCCAGAKAVIAEQKATIENLKKANEVMAERVKRLNIRLCTAKQFLKKSPLQANKGNGSAYASTSVKNLSADALVNKGSVAKLIFTQASSQAISRDPSKTKSVETNTEEVEIRNEKLDVEKVCDANKCKSAMEEFKQNINYLQGELAKTHEEYLERMSQLEQRACQLQEARSEHELRARRLREAQLRGVELEAQLSNEKRKVAELEMSLKAANMSQEVANIIVEHLSSTKQLEQLTASIASKAPNESTVLDDKPYRSDDSGYADQRDDELGSIKKVNEELANRVENLQSQLDALKNIPIDNVNKDSERTDKPIDCCSKCNEEAQDDQGNRKNRKHLESRQSKWYTVESETALCTKHVAELNKKNARQYNEIETEIKITGSNINIIEKTTASPVKEEVEVGRRGNLLPGDMSQIYKTRDFSKPLPEETEPVQEKDSLLRRNGSIEKDEKDLRSSRQLEENNVSCKVNAICECPNCDNDLSKKNAVSGTAVTNHDSIEIYKNNAHLKTNSIKPDTHNSLQIPGPLPINPGDSDTSKSSSTSNKNILLQEKKAKNGKKEADMNIYKDNVLESSKPGVMKEEKCKVCTERGAYFVDPEIKMQSRNVYSQELTKNSINNYINKPNINGEKSPNQRNKMECFDTQERIQNTESIGNEPLRDEANEARETKTVKEHVKCLNERINCVNRDKDPRKVEARIEICSRRVPICTCPQAVQRSLAICRTCSGTRTFQTKPDGALLKRCNCAQKTDFLECGLKLNDANAPPVDRRASLANSGRTYTGPGSPEVSKCSRATSPANTDHEISYMSDLPAERDVTSPKVMSPGELKTTSTYTDSYSPYKDLSLSEGEVPNENKYTKKKRLSVGEQPGDRSIGRTVHNFPESSAEKMEEALQAISRELARCRVVLQSQRPGEVVYGHRAS